MALHYASKRAIINGLDNSPTLGPRLKYLFADPSTYTMESVRDTPIILINLWPGDSKSPSVQADGDYPTTTTIVQCGALLTILDNIRNMKSSNGEGSVLKTVEILRAGGPPVAILFGNWLGAFTTFGQLVSEDSEDPSFDMEVYRCYM